MGAIIVEIRGAEGGEDAKLLVYDQLGVYTRWAARKNLRLEILENRPGLAILRILGPGAAQAFAHEGGGHRFQRIPPTEKKGRVHTSTITVAVLREPEESEIRLDPKDLDIRTVRGSGPGGQARNKLETCVVVTHKPTGITVRCDSRSQEQNRKLALGILRARLAEKARQEKQVVENTSRRAQLGSGMRGDKRRTIRYQDSVVTDHVLGKKMHLDDYTRGRLEKLYEPPGT